MFYRIILIAILLTLPIESNLLGEEKIYGGYRNCTSYIYEYKDGKIDLESKRLSETFTYDTSGNRIEYMQFYADKPTDTYCCKNPNPENQPNETEIDKNGTKYLRKSYKYDNRNNKIEEIEFQPNESILEKSTYRYDEKSREIGHISYYADSTVKEKSITKYMGIGNASENEVSYYSSDGMIEEWRYYKFGSEGEKQEWRIRKYDEKGKIIEDYLYKSDGKIYDMSNPDSEGNGKLLDIDFLDRSSMIGGSGGYTKTTYELDDKDRIIAVLKYSSETVVNIRCAFKYDNFGNTIEWIAYKFGVPIFKTEYIYSK